MSVAESTRSEPLFPPGPSGHFLHGSAPEYMVGRLAFMERMVRTYGDIVRYRLGCDVTYLINDPALCRAVFQDWDHVDNALTTGWLFLDKSYLAVQGRARALPRSIVHTSICPRSIGARHDEMVACVERMLSRYRLGETRDVLSDMMHVGVEMMSEALVGRDAHAWMTPIFDFLSDIQVLGGAYTASPELQQRLEVAARREVFEALVNALEQLLVSLPDEPERNAPPLATLLRAEQSGSLTREGLIHELGVLLLSNGSASLLAMSTLYVLALYPDVRRTLASELDRVLEGRAVSARDLSALPYLDSVLKETMRLYPPVGLIARQVVSDFRCGPLRIPAGSQIHISPHLLHRNPRHWREPERFSPERFDPSAPDHRPPPSGAYMPFGTGIRRCIGDQLAMMQVKILIATMLPRVRLALPRGYTPVYDVSPMGASYPHPVALPMVVEALEPRAQPPHEAGAEP